jgi:mRNA-degrading endonuclease toxin of MazEF toxin-antitoxin module
MTTPSRGDIVWVTFPDDDDIPDEEMDNPHMAVVLQNDGQNERRDSTIVVPISSGAATERLTEVDIPAYNEDVDVDSHAVLTQITTVSIPGRIKDQHDEPSSWKQGELSDDKMAEIESYLSSLLRI